MSPHDSGLMSSFLDVSSLEKVIIIVLYEKKIFVSRKLRKWEHFFNIIKFLDFRVHPIIELSLRVVLHTD